MTVFSIVTVVRNDKKGLEKTIESLKRQTYPHIEYIVIDGVSTDGTLDTIKNHLDRINKWKSEPDSGLYDAMNKGKKMATGDFVTFINAGDAFHSDSALEDIAKGMTEDKNIFYFGKVVIFNRDIAWEHKPYERQDSERYLPHHQAAFYPIDFCKKEDYDLHFKIISDADYTVRAAKKFKKHFIPVTVTRSELGGFTMNMFKNFKGTNIYIQDSLLFNRKHYGDNSLKGRLNVYAKGVSKFVIFNIGGTYLMNKIIAKRFKTADFTYHDTTNKDKND
jgi:putative colanic acid biosynthesis glycosyltransferase